uniref:Amidohydrolase 3 domain-containing protein n=1 Tax=Rhodosorus marinus TaxID=101924 RepID=A0A7S2ZW01_9RHOD|mmetsp:Transcript_33835/g.132905  ORF Transcript_33835/g.132905 Transcript_33835/m.132905 type:complete len:494 (+) Transcript_33835:255-1736(+)|eukprot:CAMPEP_0113964660 /NCGR_PEP_ID=MMETSP0011_2-20120614/7280_1 /TAXON_ID=101924 /ORGANISM="Rhodosorus marinus" /LENGTH=493 /DNA_ID=CAMNT_0000977021 /DNA_START=101 /DNA_END=1582 /DNA_ORIENTATION=- /assembly_acc=CAM_ASM_000156
MYDLVIANGRVMDPETLFDSVANVGVLDGQIATISKDALDGKDTIDATGLVVAPGFVDGHSHSSNDRFGVKKGLQDGRTTQLDLEAGAWPIDAYYDRMEGRAQANYGATVGHLLIRDDLFSKIVASTGNLFLEVWKSKGEWSVRTATSDEVDTIVNLAESGLKAGALGIGTPVGYAVSGVSAYEMNRVWTLAGKYKSFATVHGRFSSKALPTEGVLGIMEAIGNARTSGAGLIVHHYHAQVLSQVSEMAKIVDDANASGAKFILEVYPYTFGSSIMMADYLHPDNYQNRMGHTYEDITLVRTMKPLTKEIYEREMRENPGATILFEHCREEDMVKALAWPTVCIGSDSVPYIDSNGSHDEEGVTTVPYDTPDEEAHGHPRSAGSYAKVFRYAREQKIMPLMTAVSKTSYLLCKFLEDNGVPQMAKKGRIQVGCDADITIFDPDTIRDNATRENGAAASSGIPHVIVNGTPIVRNSTIVEGVYPGRAIRKPIME